MAVETLKRILQDLDALNPEELEQVEQAIEAKRKPADLDLKRERFHRALLAAGIVRQIKLPRDTAPPNRQIIQTTGKPVSETIIEERR